MAPAVFKMAEDAAQRGHVMRWQLEMAGGIFALACLTSCAAVSVVDTWRAPATPDERYHRIVVASVGKNMESRRIYEDIVVAELVKGGTEAVPSYRLLPGTARPNRKALQQEVKKAGADALLTIQTVRTEQFAAVQPGYATTFPDYGFTPYDNGWNGYYGGRYGGFGAGGYGGVTSYYEPPSVSTYDVDTIQVNLFDAASGSLMWAATTETAEPGRLVKVGKELARIVSESLFREGLLP